MADANGQQQELLSAGYTRDAAPCDGTLKVKLDEKPMVRWTGPDRPAEVHPGITLREGAESNALQLRAR